MVHKNLLHTCNFCNKTFKHKPAFKLHVRSVHEGIWEHCPQCNGKFQDKGDLRRHIRNVHDRNYPFRCDQCGRGFPYRTPMRDHMLKHHGIKLDETDIGRSKCSASGNMYSAQSSTPDSATTSANNSSTPDTPPPPASYLPISLPFAAHSSASMLHSANSSTSQVMRQHLVAPHNLGYQNDLPP